MTKEDLKGISIHCPTQEEAIKCCNLANKLGWGWRLGGSYTDNYWKKYGKDTCYDFYNGQFGSKDFFKISNYRIENTGWFLDSFTPGENVTEQLFGSQSILDKAKEIRAGSRQSDYGDAVENFKKIAQIASIASNKEITAEDAVNVLIAVKLVREAFHHKEDNLVDLCGYADIKNLIMEE